MVKKVGPKTPKKTQAVESSKSVNTTGGVSSSTQVEKSSKQSGSQKARGKTQPMSAAEREHLFKLVNEEAEKMFPGEKAESTRRKTVEQAVKMAIDASLVSEEEENS